MNAQFIIFLLNLIAMSQVIVDVSPRAYERFGAALALCYAVPASVIFYKKTTPLGKGNNLRPVTLLLVGLNVLLFLIIFCAGMGHLA